MLKLIKRPKIVIPIMLIGIMAITLIAFSPNATAEYWKHHNMPEITGTITADDNIQENIEKAQIHFSVATAVAENAVTDGKILKGQLGVVQGFLVYKFGVIDGNDQFHKVIVDAGNGITLYTSDGKSIDEIRQYGHGDKWSHEKMMSPHGTDYTTGMHGKMMAMHGEMKSHFADLTPEEREAKMAQYKEMKEAFSSISEDDRQSIMNHMKEMKEQYADLTEHEKTAKHTEMKTMMEEFMQLSLDEKIVKLHEFANSLRED